MNQSTRAVVSGNDPAGLSIAGMLYLRTAIASARRQDRGTIRELLEVANTYAVRLGQDGNEWHTMFGPTNVALHQMHAALDLGDVAWVIENGPLVNPATLNVERQVTHRIDLARAYAWTARDEEALAELLTAEKSSPQIVRHSAVVRDTVKALHRRGHTRGTNQPLLQLAVRCRAVQ